jgi:LmbE family N-acetylglucosaminyl deacetylase
MRILRMNVVCRAALILLLAGYAVAQGAPAAAPAAAAPPRALIVVAHPDDESCLAATVYEITHNLGGTVDQLVITNGEGGFHYSFLAEQYYGIALTDEATGRAALPEIRKRELLEAGRILGIGNHFFLDEKDIRNTKDIEEVLTQHWRPGVVLPEVARRLAEGNYDFVFTLFPSTGTHGAHKAAALTALTAVQQMSGRKPVVFGCQVTHSDAPEQPSWKGFQSEKHPFTVLPKVYATDRTVKFGYHDTLDYQIIVSWMIAAHKSQGMFQAGLNRGDREIFAILESNAADETARADALFHALAEKAPHPKGVEPNRP